MTKELLEENLSKANTKIGLLEIRLRDQIAWRDIEIAQLREDLKECRAYAAAQQARIDELMLEHCPHEMTPEQLAEYEKHQTAVGG